MNKITLIIAITILNLISISEAIADKKIDAFEKAKESVVWVNTFKIAGAGTDSYRYTGTGYSIDDSGLFITNHHVIDEAAGIVLIHNTGSTIDTAHATLLWSDEEWDLAVLKCEDMKLKSLPLADSGSLAQGDEILILGYPGSIVNNHDIKVSWGIISSKTADSTIQTTATINPGNSGGPAINYTGEVVGTVYAKMSGYQVEAIGFMKNNFLVKKAIQKAKDNGEEIEVEFLDTEDRNAYFKMCEAEAKYWELEDEEDLDKQLTIVENSISIMKEAIVLDDNYDKPKLFLVNYLFRKAQIYCEMDKEMSEKDADRTIEEFTEAYEDALHTARGSDYRRKFKNRVNYRIYDLADVDDIKCERWRKKVENRPNNRKARENRYEDFNDYIAYGATPGYLRYSLLNPTWEHSRYKKYDAFVNELPMSIYITPHLSLGSGFDNILSMLEFDVEPWDDFRFSLGFGLSPLQLDTIGTDKNGKNLYNEGLPIVLGVTAWNYKLSYAITDVEGLPVMVWSAEYHGGISGDGFGEIEGSWWFGIGEYKNSEKSGLALKLGYEKQLYNQFYINPQLIIGFGGHEELQQLGIGIGYRY